MKLSICRLKAINYCFRSWNNKFILLHSYYTQQIIKIFAIFPPFSYELCFINRKFKLQLSVLKIMAEKRRSGGGGGVENFLFTLKALSWDSLLYCFPTK